MYKNDVDCGCVKIQLVHSYIDKDEQNWMMRYTRKYCIGRLADMNKFRYQKIQIDSYKYSDNIDRFG